MQMFMFDSCCPKSCTCLVGVSSGGGGLALCAPRPCTWAAFYVAQAGLKLSIFLTRSPFLSLCDVPKAEPQASLCGSGWPSALTVPALAP